MKDIQGVNILAKAECIYKNLWISVLQTKKGKSSFESFDRGIRIKPTRFFFISNAKFTFG